MLKIEKIKEEILNFNNANDALRCYLARVTTKQSNIDGCCRPNLRCEEYLKVAKENEYNFIARDKDNRLYGTSEKPKKYNTTWASSGAYIAMFKSMFKFVKWEDEEPYNIDEILSNCEVIEDGNLD